MAVTPSVEAVDWSVVGDLRCALGESPVWDETTERLLVVAVFGRAVHVLDPVTGAARGVGFDRPVTALVPRTGGAWLAVAGRDLGALNPDFGAFRPVMTLPGPSDLALNDAVCGRNGELYVGSVDRTGARRAALYALGVHLRHRVVADGVGASNGVDTSPDGRILYHADTFAGTVTAYGPNGRLLWSVGVDRPDGIAVDADGGVWVALWGSGAVHRYTAELAPDRAIRVPVPLVTNVSFGGPDLGTLFVTTARSGGAALSGAVFATDLGLRGLPPARFAA